jgi:hypothetical protein
MLTCHSDPETAAAAKKLLSVVKEHLDVSSTLGSKLFAFS